jgi:hypothetical protein
MKNLTHERLRELLSYDPDTGIFIWRRTLKAAGAINSRGYQVIKIGGTILKAHRLAIFYMTEHPPFDVVDHIDGNKTNNRYSNLRPCTKSENQHNRIRAWGKSGLLGVVAIRKRFRATIFSDGKQRHLGMFDTPEEAHRAYLAAKAIHHPTAPRRSNT